MDFLLIVLLFNLVVTVFSVSGSGTNEEKNQILLQQLRLAVEKNVTKSYETEDALLLRFLRASDFDVQRASEMVLKNLKWRAENNIDGIVNETNLMDKDLKYTWGTARDGRFTILVKSTELDVRKMVLKTGSHELIVRAFVKLMEKLLEESRNSNFSQMVGIVDLNGFSLRKHTCPKCMKLGLELLQTVENYYPEFCAAFFTINTPRIYEVILKIIKANLTPHSRRILHVYGFDQQEWSEALLEWISPEQLYKFFGHHHKLRHEKHTSTSAKKIVETSKFSGFNDKILWQTQTKATTNVASFQAYTNIVLIFFSFTLSKLF